MELHQLAELVQSFALRQTVSHVLDVVVALHSSVGRKWGAAESPEWLACTSGEMKDSVRHPYWKWVNGNICHLRIVRFS